MSARLSSEFSNTYTDRFHDFRAALVSVCGRPALERYEKATASDSHNVASVTKSVVSTLVGIALADGSLQSLDRPLSQLLPDHAGDMTAPVGAITPRQLLTMTAGLDADKPDSSTGPWIDSTDFVREILRQGIQQPAGHFAYSSATSHLLAAILVKATGRPLLDYARENLFDPLGIVTRPAAQPLLVPARAGEYEKAGFAWPVDHQGNNFGAGFLKLTPADMLKVGQLYLDGGQVNGRQVVPSQWVHDSTKAEVSTQPASGGAGYGYQWWVIQAGSDHAYSARGFGGQLIEVIPARRMVAVFATEIPPEGQAVRLDGSTYEEIVARVIAPLVTP